MCREDVFMCWRGVLCISAMVWKVLEVHATQQLREHIFVVRTFASSLNLTAHQTSDGGGGCWVQHTQFLVSSPNFLHQ